MGKNLHASNAEIVDASDAIVIPGFIDSHRHTWQSQVRQLAVDWPFLRYLQDMFGKFGTNYRPEDVYAGVLLGRLTALNGGVTTMLDWSHIMNSPLHADANIQALKDAGVRSVFAMGWPQTPNPALWLQKSTRDLPDDIRRVRKQYFSSNSGLVTMQMAGRGPTPATIRLLGHGITPSLSPDTEAFGPGDMFAVMKAALGSARYAAANPPDANAQLPGPPQQFNGANQIPIRKILEMATVAGAAPVELDGKAGTLTPGKFADIVLLRMSSLNYFPVNEPAAAIVMSADTSCVDAVFVAGKAVKFNGRLVDQALEKRARRLALQSRNWLYEKAGMTPPDGLQNEKV